MSDRDKQFVDAVSRWRKADEKDARIAALEAECERLREALEVMVEMVEMNGFGRAYAMDVARAALAAMQRTQSENKDSK